MTERQVVAILKRELAGLRQLDSDVYEYLESMLADVSSHGCEHERLIEMVGPFLLSSGFCETDERVEEVCTNLADKLREVAGSVARVDDSSYAGNNGASSSPDGNGEFHDTPKLLDAPVTIGTQDTADREALDKMWGKDKVREQFNQRMEQPDRLNKKERRREERFLEKQLEELAKINGTADDDAAEISMMVLPDYSSGSNERDIHVHNFGLSLGGLELLDGADLKLAHGRRYGLIGKNGVGKTTLLKHMAMYDIEGFPRHHRVLHVQQEIKASDKSVVQVVVDSDVERLSLLKEEKEITDRQQARTSGSATSPEEISAATADTKRLSELYDRLSQIDASTAEARAATILSGLGFSTEMQRGPTGALSGGWRMRVAIAGALFIEPDLLMLDEPTNHLDLDAVLWLQDYLKSYKKTLLLVSHDRAFLNEVTTDIIFFHAKKLNYYKGNYDTFEAVRAEQLKQQKRAFEAQQAKKEHMKEFIDKFRANAKRASLVQSRIKALDKMDDVADVEEEGHFRFNLPDPGPLGRPIIQVEGVGFGYGAEGSKQLFSDVHFGIDLESRIGIVGPNGAGKSTLLNLILDNKLRPLDGMVHRHANLRIASFTQHHGEQFDYRRNAVDNLLTTFADKKPQVQELEMRSFLGKYDISGPMALRPLKFLSGGQKSRVAFAALGFAKPHVVVMDEPTNHLDMDTIDALIAALKDFHGGVLVVSHDQHFISQVCNEIWVVGEGKVRRFQGTFDDYKKETLRKRRQLTPTP